jgi:AcrR family transcriptional regulator
MVRSETSETASVDAESRRGQETRRRLLDTAMDLFGKHGYDGVSNRKLADAADVNSAAISYHFGSKRQLYLATAAHFASTIRDTTRPFLDQAVAMLSEADADTTVDLLRRFMRGMAFALLRGPANEATVGFMYREQIQPTEAFDVLFEGALKPLFEGLSRIIGHLRDRAHDDPEVVVVAHVLHGMILSFRASHTTILRRLGKESLSDDDVEQIAGVVADLAVAAVSTELTTPSATHSERDHGRG